MGAVPAARGLTQPITAAEALSLEVERNWGALDFYLTRRSSAMAQVTAEGQ